MTTTFSSTPARYDTDAAVTERYREGALTAEPSLCCPTDYDPQLLKILPKEVIEKDYGCGDPSKWVSAGDTVVDLGSGAGKICYMLAQKVGAAGNVIGVDMTDEMLDVARRHQPDIAAKLGYDNVRFVKGRIQDMALDLDRAEKLLAASPLKSVQDVQRYEAECDRLRREEPMVPSDSVDVVVSNCVLNLVRPQDKRRLFGEIFRVLNKGGRAVISDIVCDEPPTEKIMNDPELWSGCIAGAFGEHEFLRMFEEAGFHGIEILSRQEEPWHTVDGIEFRSVTVRAFKGKQGPCFEHNQAVVYAGPWKQVVDDDGHTYHRGQRMAVCKKTFDLMTDSTGPYAGSVLGIEPREAVAEADARPFDCSRTELRHPRETKGAEYDATKAGGTNASCGPEGSCSC